MTSSLLSNEYSLEDLMVGKFSKPSQIGKEDRNFLLSTNSSFKNSIVDKDCKDHLPFAIESMMLYNEAEQFGTFATESLHTMNNEYRLMVSIANKYGIENFNPYKFGLEEDKPKATSTGKVKRIALIKRIWAAIVTAFQRLIASVGNFMRSIMNWFASNGVKKMTKLYEANKDKLNKVSSKDINVKDFKASVPIKKVLIILSDLTNSVSAMTKASETFNTKSEELSNLVKRLEGNEINDTSKIKDFIRRLKGYKSPDQVIDDIMKTVIDAVTFNNKDVKAFLTQGGKFKMKDPSGVARIIFYGKGKVKTASVKIDDFLKMVPFSVLSQKSVDEMKKFVDGSRKAVKTLNNSLKGVRKSAKQAEVLMTKQAKQGNVAITQQALNMLTNYGNVSRRFNSFMVGIILNVYKEFMRIQSYSYRLAKTVVGGKKGKTEDKSKKK